MISIIVLSQKSHLKGRIKVINSMLLVILKHELMG